MRTPRLMMLAAALAASAGAAESAADLAVRLRHYAPHFREPAGSPIAGFTRGAKAYSYANQPFDVGKPEQVMPTGAGRLSAMVAMGDRLELHLSSTEYYDALADNRSETRKGHANDLLSPGHVSIEFGGIKAGDIRRFDQHLDFTRGSVVVELETKDGWVMAEVAGDMRRDTLVVTVVDRRPQPQPAKVRYENWRDTTAVSGAAGRLTAVEVPQLTGATGAAAQSMSLAVQIGCVNGNDFVAQAGSHAGTLEIPASAAGSFTVVIAAQAAHGAAPAEAAAEAWTQTATTAPGDRLSERLAWWQNYWSQSSLQLDGPDADDLVRLWYTTLYSYACVGQGPVLPKFNGGPGLVYKDARSWGDGYWWQNQRELSFWPMAGAGHPEFTRRSVRFFNQAFSAAQARAAKLGMSGLCLNEGTMPAEWSVPFGSDYPLAEPQLPAFAPSQITPEAALAARRLVNPGYNAENFSPQFEYTQAVFDYVQYTGDAEVARQVAAPWLKGSAVMALNLLTVGADGKYHVQCADATEQWWKVDDPAPLLAGIEWTLKMTIRHGHELGLEDTLVAAAADRLAKLTALPTVGSWTYRTTKPKNLFGCPAESTPGDQLLAPYGLPGSVIAHNQENPELYAVFPYALYDLNSPAAELELARRSFAHRFFPISAGWSQCPVQAARLGLPEAFSVIAAHAHKFNRWPYGGWTSPGGQLYPQSPTSDSPYFDAPGVEMTAVQEALLQSHAPIESSDLFDAGIIRLLPAVNEQWSGQFLLHSRGGFTVTVRFSHGRVQSAQFAATRTAMLRVHNPFPAAMIAWQGHASVRKDPIITQQLQPGEVLTLGAAR